MKNTNISFLPIIAILLSACGSQRTSPAPAMTKTHTINPIIRSTPTEQSSLPVATIQDVTQSTPSMEPSSIVAELEITFVAVRQEGPPGIFSVRLGCPDENPPCIGEPRLLFANRLIDDLSEISWSPTGDQVVFDSRPGPNLFISTNDGSDLRNLTESLPKGVSPAWSPDGSQITYTSCQDQPCRIFGINLEDYTVDTLVGESSTYGGIEAVWSADNTKLVFNAYPNKNLDTMHIFVLNVKRGEVIQLTHGVTDSYAPWISPDGQKVVYMGTFDINSGQDLFISDLEGNSRILITNPDGSVSDPAWSPIDGWIAFRLRTEEGGDDLFLIREDGTHLYQITDTPDVSEGSPAWRVSSP